MPVTSHACKNHLYQEAIYVLAQHITPSSGVYDVAKRMDVFFAAELFDVNEVYIAQAVVAKAMQIAEAA